MTHSGLIRRTLTDFFREVLRGAMRTHEVESSEPTEHYLVNLLERFAKPAPDWDDRPLALAYLESFHHPRPQRGQHHQQQLRHQEHDEPVLWHRGVRHVEHQ